MNDVIEVMEKSRNEYLSDQGRFDGTTREMIVYMLQAAEKTGWRLVPVEPTEEIIQSARGHMMFDAQIVGAWNEMLQAAPRPWDEDTQEKDDE